MSGARDVAQLDLYELLELSLTATESEIKKAYRKKALQCHPDKNPDNPKAAEKFHELSRALEILSDASARAAYDKVLKAKAAAKLRHRELDSKRQKLKEDLERREREAEFSSKSFDNRTDEQKLAAEIERLQREGSLMLQKEQQRMKEEILKGAERLGNFVWDSSLNRIKIRWNTEKNDKNNGGYSEELLRKYFKKYGEIVALIMSPKKKGSALVEFTTREASEMAIDLEKGLPQNPLILKWVSEIPVMNVKKQEKKATLVSDRDYESLVLTKMRQAAERQKLIEEMMKEEQ